MINLKIYPQYYSDHLLLAYFYKPGLFIQCLSIYGSVYFSLSALPVQPASYYRLYESVSVLQISALIMVIDTGCGQAVCPVCGMSGDH